MSDNDASRASSREGRSSSVEISVTIPQASQDDHGPGDDTGKTTEKDPEQTSAESQQETISDNPKEHTAPEDTSEKDLKSQNEEEEMTEKDGDAGEANDQNESELEKAEISREKKDQEPAVQNIAAEENTNEKNPKSVTEKQSDRGEIEKTDDSPETNTEEVKELEKGQEPDGTATAEEEAEVAPNVNEAVEKSQSEESDKTEDEKPPDPPSTPTSRNVEAIQAALDSNKETGSGFVLSSQFEDKEGENQAPDLPRRPSPEGGASAGVAMKLSTTTVRFQTGMEREKETERTYITEPPERESRPTSREAHTYSPAYFDTAVRPPPEGGWDGMSRTMSEIRAKKLERLNLPRPPRKHELKLQPPKQDPDPTNRAPLNPNIYVTEVPREGGRVKTPFYMQVEIPNGTLDGRARLKFEKQEFDRMNLGLTENDMLCSYVVDLNMEPLAYCLRRNAKVKMRILDKCVNQYEETIIITARHFSWTRIPTKVESRQVNGEKHYYAVTDTQNFGKFAVINTKRMDRFVIARAGGLFHSTIIPEISLKVDEGDLTKYKPQLIEMLVKETREEAVKRINKEIGCISDVEGKLVASSPLIEITKSMMGQSGKLKEGIKFPKKVTLNVPVPIPPKTTNKEGLPPRRSIVIAQRQTPPSFNIVNGHRYLPKAYGEGMSVMWEDVTENNRLAVDGVAYDENEKIAIKVTAPGKYLVLVFEESDTDVKDDLEFDLHDLASGVNEVNQEFLANIMIHQKISQPSMFFIHMVTSDAIQPIHETMRSTNAWKQVYVSRELVMHEWQPIRLEFKGDLRPTVNQMSPRIRFYSRRWQGYQIQLEATQEAYASSAEDQFTGTISFIEETNDIQKKFSSTSVSSEEEQVLCDAEVTISQTFAEPFKPTVVVKAVPKVPIYREYKMKWLKHLSEEEMERYRSAHGI